MQRLTNACRLKVYAIRTFSLHRCLHLSTLSCAIIRSPIRSPAQRIQRRCWQSRTCCWSHSMPHKAIHDRCVNTDPRAAASCSLLAVPTTTQCLLRWAKVPTTQLLTPMSTTATSGYANIKHATAFDSKRIYDLPARFEPAPEFPRCHERHLPRKSVGNHAPSAPVTARPTECCTIDG